MEMSSKMVPFFQETRFFHERDLIIQTIKIISKVKIGHLCTLQVPTIAKSLEEPNFDLGEDNPVLEDENEMKSVHSDGTKFSKNPESGSQTGDPKPSEGGKSPGRPKRPIEATNTQEDKSRGGAKTPEDVRRLTVAMVHMEIMKPEALEGGKELQTLKGGSAEVLENQSPGSATSDVFQAKQDDVEGKQAVDALGTSASQAVDLGETGPVYDENEVGIAPSGKTNEAFEEETKF